MLLAAVAVHRRSPRSIILAAALEDAGMAAWVPVQAETLSDRTYAIPEEPVEDQWPTQASPSTLAPIDQDKLETILRAGAAELGADMRFSTELLSFDQDEDGVTAVVRDRRTGAETVIEAGYLVAADGAASPIRQRLGIGVEGPGPLYDTITAIVEADLNPALRGRQASIAYLQQPRPFTILMSHDLAGLRWVFGTGYSAAHESLEDYTDERVAGMVRAAGLPDLEVRLRPQIPGTDLKVLGFPIGAQVAEQYRVGRTFLVGDAAHWVPPTGGLGANTGIQDAHNLAWKLARVAQSRAGPGLLDTHHDERRPVGLLTMRQALARFGARMQSNGSSGLIDYPSIVFGYQYRSSAVLGAGEDTAPMPPEDLAGQPGTRAPHVPVTLDGRRLSTLDLYGSRFVLLAGPEGSSWVSAARAVTGHPDVDAYRFGAELAEVEGAAAHGIGADGALLVRPDGFVAWRSAPSAERPGHGDRVAELEGVFAAVLSRGA